MMKKSFFCVFFLITLTLIVCTVLAGKIEEEMTLEVIGYEKRVSFTQFLAPEYMLFHDENGSHLYEVYEGTGWESGLHTREIATDVIIDRDYIIVRGASRQPMNGESVRLYDGKDTGPCTYLAYYPEGIPEANQYLSQAVILEESEHVLLLYQECGTLPFTENGAKGSMVQLSAAGWKVYDLASLDQLLNNIPDCMIAIVLVAALAVLGISVCFLVYFPNRKKWLLLINIIAILVLMILLGQILSRIDLPSSMLPHENIFIISHYKAELAEIYHALEELESNTTLTFVQLRETMLQKGNRILFFGSIAIGIFITMEVLWSLRHVSKRTKYRILP